MIGDGSDCRTVPSSSSSQAQAWAVCPPYLRRMQGAMATLDAPITGERLDPPVQSDLRITHVPAPTTAL
jgi:hypothetical protein